MIDGTKNIDGRLALTLEIEGLIRITCANDSSVDKSAEVNSLLHKKIEQLMNLQQSIVATPVDETSVLESSALIDDEMADDEYVVIVPTENDEADLNSIASAADFEEQNDADIDTQNPYQDVVDLPDKKITDLEKLSEPGRHIPFTINDIFRYRRELFDGSDNRFMAFKSQLQLQESYAEAERLVVNRFGSPEDNPEVASFLEIVRQGF